MAYEQFYTAGYLLICYILTDLSYLPYRQSDFLDIKDGVGIFVKKAF